MVVIKARIHSLSQIVRAKGNLKLSYGGPSQGPILVIVSSLKPLDTHFDSLGGDAFTRNTSSDLEVKVTQNVAQYPLYHMTYAPAV